ncbi:hypothetical protein LVY72_18620 [Arthrobacter sp. I2-34]|uniref:Uncharacterized protein n=1 Tax=Arthrobacter hankyongi TaxID=2904801 RepID=A0ABS9LB60_9MICC|nr:hypothetical protein [Arthrobacter hankyongi]MCG2623912.1 hypothetical protein [Arthrobacter hankyongi]
MLNTEFTTGIHPYSMGGVPPTGKAGGKKAVPVTAHSARHAGGSGMFRPSVGTAGAGLLSRGVMTFSEAGKEGDCRKPGFSMERRAEPQSVLGRPADHTGFALEMHPFEGNMAESTPHHRAGP